MRGGGGIRLVDLKKREFQISDPLRGAILRDIMK